MNKSTMIGNKIQALRMKAGYTQSNVAQFLEVDQSLISKIEKGERALSAGMLEKLVTLFGVTVEQIETDAEVASRLTYAFRGSELSAKEMEAVYAINKIALNSQFMHDVLKREKND